MSTTLCRAGFVNGEAIDLPVRSDVPAGEDIHLCLLACPWVSLCGLPLSSPLGDTAGRDRCVACLKKAAEWNRG
jgi:hypothetical protein